MARRPERRTIACRRAISPRSRSGWPTSRRKARAPMAVRVRSSTPSRLPRVPPVPKERVSSRLRRVAASSPTQRPGDSSAQSGQQRQQRRVGALQIGEHRRRRRRWRPAYRRSRIRPASGRRNWVQSMSAARSGAQRHDSRRVRCPGVCVFTRGGSGASSGTRRFGRVEADDLLRQPRHGVLSGKLGDGELPGADVDPGQSPAFAEVMDCREIAVLPGREEGGSATVPGVITRVTARSTRPRPGGLICSAMATVCPAASSRPR